MLDLIDYELIVFKLIESNIFGSYLKYFNCSIS